MVVFDKYKSSRHCNIFFQVFDAHGELIRRKEMAAAKIELSARILLPTFFGVLNLIFWISVSV